MFFERGGSMIGQQRLPKHQTDVSETTRSHQLFDDKCAAIINGSPTSRGDGPPVRPSQAPKLWCGSRSRRSSSFFEIRMHSIRSRIWVAVPSMYQHPNREGLHRASIAHPDRSVLANENVPFLVAATWSNPCNRRLRARSRSVSEFEVLCILINTCQPTLERHPQIGDSVQLCRSMDDQSH